LYATSTNLEAKASELGRPVYVWILLQERFAVASTYLLGKSSEVQTANEHA
jgi:hypothetical protein